MCGHLGGALSYGYRDPQVSQMPAGSSGPDGPAAGPRG